MNDDNPYRAPDAKIEAPAVESGGTASMAGRLERFLAVLIDSVLMIAISFPILYAIGYFDTSAESDLWFGLVEEALIAVGFFVLFLLVQGGPLYCGGQTWGKRALGIRIVDANGRMPEFWRMVALRYLPFDAVSSIPVIGWLITVIDSPMIFREDRRCLHDMVADTRVVAIERPDRP